MIREKDQIIQLSYDNCTVNMIISSQVSTKSIFDRLSLSLSLAPDCCIKVNMHYESARVRQQRSAFGDGFFSSASFRNVGVAVAAINVEVDCRAVIR